ncbi:MAG: flgK [Hyphomicrobiales bacterium]|nr:flgK [Hyphomicrobiales bacterium]
MSLTSALTSARNSLSVRATETEIVSRNVAGVNEAGYTLKRANVSTEIGGVRVIGVARNTDNALFQSLVKASADAASRSAVLSGVGTLQQTVDPALGDATPTGRLGALADALTQAAAAPSDQMLAQNAVDKAQDLVRTLQDASATVQQVRTTADADIATSVSNINSLLKQFATVNARVVANTATGKDATTDLDARDKLLTQLSGEIGIRTAVRQNGDMQIYTDGGSTLFDTSPRDVTFAATTSFDTTISGNAVMIDGLPATGPDAVMGVKSGRIFGLAQVRDSIAPAYQGQLDEIARGLISAYSETNTSGDPSSVRAGLFRDGTSTAVPAGPSAGLASRLSIAATVDRKQGGNPFLLRDGGISNPADPAYKFNTTSAASFSDRLRALSTAAEQPQTFATSGGAITSGSLSLYASSSTGWIEGQRQTASTESDQKAAFLDRATLALSAATGVSLDTEMSKMLDLERAYQGSAKIISVVDSMLQSLLQAAG